MKNTSAPSKSNRLSNTFLVLAFILSVCVVIFGYFMYQNYYKAPKKVNVIPQLNTQNQTSSIDTIGWLNFPDPGNDLGFELKYPVSNEPLINQNNTQINIINNNQDAVLVLIDMNNKTQVTDMQKYLNVLEKNDDCVQKTPFTKTLINGQEAYVSTSDCAPNSEGDSIFFKDRTLYVIQNPYIRESYLQVGVYVDKKIASEKDIQLADTILSTLKIVNN